MGLSSSESRLYYFVLQYLLIFPLVISQPLWDRGNYTSVPKQLNQSAFAFCLSDPGQGLPDLEHDSVNHEMNLKDGLLLYLSLYAGQRFPVINESLQQPAYERWSVAQNDQERLVVNTFSQLVVSQQSPSTTPRQIFRTAIDACNQIVVDSGGDPWIGQGDVFCAALTCHNVLRALGRRDTYYDQQTGVDYAPKWLKNNESYWIDTFAPLMQSSMIPLRNDGGGDGWGEWYHTFGLLTYGIHQSALLGIEMGGILDYGIALADTLVAAIVTPDHKPEDPVKARVDRDVARVLTHFLYQNYSSMNDMSICDIEAGYVLPLPLKAYPLPHS